ncbi:MAG TPA: error-prone DNA polymerase [Acidimicrobiales bacterium]|nr:error-prone DNA polymerase [Acidimicrobiales bacterium]
MAFNNPAMSWSALHRRLTDRPAGADGGDSPAWSNHREKYTEPPALIRRRATTPYAELHCHSNFSFLDGASPPEELAEEAARLGLEALAVTDHDGFYGVVRFAEAARALGLPTIFGAELSLRPPGVERLEPRAGSDKVAAADPHADHLLIVARNPQGYASLARAIGEAHLAGGEKGYPTYEKARLCELHKGNWVVLTGCRKSRVPAALHREGPAAAARELSDIVACFGRDNVVVELWDHGDPMDSARNDALVQLAARQGLGVVATNNVHYASPARRPLATALAAVRARRSLDDIEPWLPSSASACLRSGGEQARRFARYPGVVEAAAELGRACAFDLSLVAPSLPPFPVPPGHTEMTYLRLLTEMGAQQRYGRRGEERVPGAYKQIDHELALIEQLGFPGYFLVVWDLCDFARRSNIFCQGRGSAANSAVCYALGITNADAVSLGLLFERFLSPERDGPPDIDIDLESGRREEVIQYVYEKHGRQNAAQVANVITYRAKSAVRDMGRALGAAPGQLDAWAKEVDSWGGVAKTAAMTDITIPQPVIDLALQVEHFPRHLGIHSGGMVICDRPVLEVVPVEWGRMPGRTVLQWDKDDCAAVGLVKFDLLGLGMLEALHGAVDLVREFHGVDVDLATIPQEDCIYDMVCAADTVGVFQIESRAQMATLPRLRPRNFYDLVVEIALIRPGPIQGGSVHPYIRRRNGEEPVTYLHPLLEKSLKKTLGVPLFQEQLMQMAIDVAGFSAADADQLRQAMGSKRSHARMDALRKRFFDGMARNGIDEATGDLIWDKLAAFANYGFPESHSVSFAYLVYSSCWLKYHYPAAFCAALLNAQPMGFWSPATLTADARRHGVRVFGPDVNASRSGACLEADTESAGGFGIRLGIGAVRSIGDDVAERIAAARPYTSIDEVARAAQLTVTQLEALATAGAFDCFGVARREALWSAGAVAEAARPNTIPGVVVGVGAPRLPGMTAVETTAADLWATGVSPNSHAMAHLRPTLVKLGALPAIALRDVPDRTKVTVGGVVTHRQRPATAGGATFLNLEDETGLVNVVCSQGVWNRYRRAARGASALLIRGVVESASNVINLRAEKIETLSLPIASVPQSRDFR